MSHSDYERRLTAVLGPTNTGKTYLAIDRMLGHDSGMIGFPLRLLARENYDRVRKLRGAGAVALITGEERIVPPNPRYFMCTVEAMPLDREVAFLAIDEIQLCADPERGHVFTDRLLHARGREETMFLGAETIAGLIGRLVSGVTFESRPRFSSLSYSGHKKVTGLPARSAVIGFSATNVYALAELIRRQKGGAAVVLGALSPRTRNAQVALYEEGDVDYIVATDAIGMGLNMSINHVAFSATSKFDGNNPRRLTAAEIGQIAGRAGRHTADGTFGTTADQRPFDSELVEALEGHEFEPLRQVYWRNRDLDFSNPVALRNSLDRSPPRRELARARIADDYAALSGLIEDAEIMQTAATPDIVKLLWATCQIPNFRGDMADGHQRLASRIFKFLTKGDCIIPTDWTARAIDRLERTDGDIDTLIGRIAHVRTWTYISHRADWLHDAAHWQERSRAIEDALSDALHERLAQKFVDTRATTLLRQIGKGEELLAAVTAGGDVIVEGTVVGRLVGMKFAELGPRSAAAIGAAKGAEGQILAAAKRALRGEVQRRVADLERAPVTDFRLREDSIITWRGDAVARLGKGGDPGKPTIVPLPSELLDPPLARRMAASLERWLDDYLCRRLPALQKLRTADLSGAMRGLAWQLLQGLGSARLATARPQIDALSTDDKTKLTALGVQFGQQTVYLGPMMSHKALNLRRTLWRAYSGKALTIAADSIVVQSPSADDLNEDDCLALGYTPVGKMAVRTTILEPCLALLKQREQRRRHKVKFSELQGLQGEPTEVLLAIVKASGINAKSEKDGLRLLPARSSQQKRRVASKVKGKAKHKNQDTAAQKPTAKAKAENMPRRKTKRRQGSAKPAADGPFAKLKQLQTIQPN